MSADRQREIPIRLVVGVALLVVGATWVAAVSFGSYPWLAIAFGVLLLGLSWRLWRLQQNQTVVVIFALYSVAFIVLGIWVWSAHLVNGPLAT